LFNFEISEQPPTATVATHALALNQ